MPIIFDLKCSTCGYKGYATNTGLVVFDDGREEILGHPAEDVTARRLTGLTLEQLVSSDRIRYAHRLICGGCGQVATYTRDDLGLPTRSGDHHVYFSQLTYHPSGADTAGVKCKACGRPMVLSMDKHEGVICPNCGAATQSMEVGGIS